MSILENNLMIATFPTPQDELPKPHTEKPTSAWDNLRARAQQQQTPPPQQSKEKDVWGEDK